MQLSYRLVVVLYSCIIIEIYFNQVLLNPSELGNNYLLRLHVAKVVQKCIGIDAVQLSKHHNCSYGEV